MFVELFSLSRQRLLKLLIESDIETFQRERKRILSAIAEINKDYGPIPKIGDVIMINDTFIKRMKGKFVSDLFLPEEKIW
jgi:hypothetical protein